MRTFKTILLEKLKINASSHKYRNFEIDELPPSTPEKAEAACEYLKDRYGHMFDDIRVLKTNNVSLGMLNDKYNKGGDGMYDDSAFTLYLNTDFNKGYLIRRIQGIGQWSKGTPAKFIQNIDKIEDVCNKFDQLLAKRGYNV
jgi:hypothetical protein